MQPPTDLLSEAFQVLDNNDRSTYTQPAADLYPHQWLWDSCFIAIGLRHKDPIRAKSELLSLLRGQWQNGMLPNIIFSDDPKYATDRNIWRSWVSPYAPDDVRTTGITQPPILAEAVIRVGESLSSSERKKWYEQMYPPLVRYHQWLYAERDPHHEGLVLQIHPWEIGMDNTPPWMSELHEHQLSWWIRAMRATKADSLVSLFRRDTKSVPSKERFDNIEALAMFDIQRRLRRKSYDINHILDHSMFAIEDVAFNSILIRNNELLKIIAKSINEKVSSELLENIERTKHEFSELWDPLTMQYYSRDFITHRLIKEPAAGTLLALYSGAIPRENAELLVHLLKDKHAYATNFPIPTAPLASAWYKPNNYWQGPSWVNINWMVIDGLKRYGFISEAEDLRRSTLAMITSKGCYEYFNSETGNGLGSRDFSWTAALAIDLCLSPLA